MALVMETPRTIRETLAAIAAVEPHLQAFVALRDEADAIAQAARSNGPLAGQCVAVKDIFDTVDLPTAYGSPIYEGHRPAFDAAMVGIIERAGGVVIGKAATTEFAHLQPAATRNPAAPGCTPGGSSAGSAAAVGAGLVPFAIGSQTGGSVIRPASYCGVAGFKPSFGLLPTAGMKCFSWSLDTVGLFARDVAGLSRFAHAVSGERLAAAAPRAPGEWVFGIPSAYPWGDASESARKALDHAAEALSRAGARIERCELPGWAGEAFTAHDAIQGWESVRALRHEMETRLADLSPILRDYLVASLAVSDAAYALAQSHALRSRAGCSGWLPAIDVLLTPSAPDEPPEGFGSTGVSTFNRAWTLLGTPCVNVPGATGVNAGPMGLQVIARPGCDGLALAAAAVLEQALQAA